MNLVQVIHQRWAAAAALDALLPASRVFTGLGPDARLPLATSAWVEFWMAPGSMPSIWRKWLEGWCVPGCRRSGRSRPFMNCTWKWRKSLQRGTLSFAARGWAPGATLGYRWETVYV